MPLGALLASVLIGAGCRPGGSRLGSAAGDSTELAARAARLDSALAAPDSGKKKTEPLARWILPASLAEISGLALTPDGRLFTHDDEIARVVELDYRRGSIVKQFSLGSPPLHGDFEAITWTPSGLFLLESDGRLFEFREAADGATVSYTVHDLHLRKQCEFEGLAYEPASGALLLACKRVRPGTDKFLVIYRWKPGNESVGEPLKVPLERVIGSHDWNGFHPSDITIEPASGNYVLVSSLEKALLELTPRGDVVFARSLQGRHPQPEGVAITSDGLLLISDEAGKRNGSAAAITVYRWP